MLICVTVKDELKMYIWIFVSEEVSDIMCSQISLISVLSNREGEQAKDLLDWVSYLPNSNHCA